MEYKTCNEQLYAQVAAELDLSPSRVREAVNAMSRFIAETIKSENMENLYIPYFGKFKVRVKYIQWVNEMKIVKGKPRPRGGEVLK